MNCRLPTAPLPVAYGYLKMQGRGIMSHLLSLNHSAAAADTAEAAVALVYGAAAVADRPIPDSRLAVAEAGRLHRRWPSIVRPVAARVAG